MGSNVLAQIKTTLTENKKIVILYKLYKRLRVVRRSPYENIYYCCTQKTASQWFNVVFSDPIVHKYTGLDVFPFDQVVDRLQDARFYGPFPKYTIGSHLYIDYPTYLTIPKPAKYRTFFILRDPRDIVVSWYFSVRYSHPIIGKLPKFRNDLENLSLSEGLKYSIDKIGEAGLFDAQRSWMHVSEDRENIRIFRYEDFVRDDCSFLKQLFDYLDIEMPEKDFSIQRRISVCYMIEIDLKNILEVERKD